MPGVVLYTNTQFSPVPRILSWFGLCSEKRIISSFVCNSNEKERGLKEMRSKFIVWVPSCLILNHVTVSTDSSNRCIKYSLRVNISINCPLSSRGNLITRSVSVSVNSYILINTWLFSTPKKVLKGIQLTLFILNFITECLKPRCNISPCNGIISIGRIGKTTYCSCLIFHQVNQLCPFSCNFGQFWTDNHEEFWL